MSKQTNHGFIFGSMDVSRTCHEKNGAHTVSIETPKTMLSIRATKTGQVRFYDDQGNECELVSKSHIEELEAWYKVRKRG